MHRASVKESYKMLQFVVDMNIWPLIISRPMTTANILRELRKAGKPVSRMQLHRYFLKFKIAPLGVRQRPQQYPPDSSARILFGLGIVDRIEIPANGGEVKRLKAGKLVTLNGKISPPPENGNGPALHFAGHYIRQPGKAIKAGHHFNGNGGAASRPARPTSGTERKPRSVAGIASMNQLRAERAKARGAK